MSKLIILITAGFFKVISSLYMCDTFSNVSKTFKVTLLTLITKLLKLVGLDRLILLLSCDLTLNTILLGLNFLNTGILVELVFYD